MNEVRKRFRNTAFLNFIIVILGIITVFSLTLIIQSNYAADRLQQNTLAKLKNAEIRLEQNRAEAQENWESFYDAMYRKIQTAAILQSNITNDSSLLHKLADSSGFDQISVYSSPSDLEAGAATATPEIREQLFSGEKYVLEEQDDKTIAWFCAPLQNGRKLIGSKVCTQYALEQKTLASADYTFNGLELQTDAHILLLDRETNNLVFASDALSRNAFQLGRHDDRFIVLDDERYAYTAYEGTSYIFVSLVPLNVVTYRVKSITLILTALFLLVLVLVCLYAHFIREEYEEEFDKDSAKDPDYRKIIFGFSIDVTLYYKSRNAIFLSMVSIFLLSTFMQMLFAAGSQHFDSEYFLETLDATLSENNSRILTLSEQYTTDYTDRANEIALILAEDPTLLNREDITRIAETQGISTLYVFDEEGHTQVTNDLYQDFAISTNPEDQSYAFWSVINGYTDVYVQELQADASTEHRMMQYIGVHRQDAPGMIQIGVTADIIQKRMARTQLSDLLASVTIENDGYLLAIDSESQNLLYWINPKTIGQNALNLGLTKQALSDHYSGWQRLYGYKYYTNTSKYEDTYLITAIPKDNIYAHVTTISLVITLNCGLLTFLILFLLLKSSERLRDRLITIEGEEIPASSFYTILRNNRRQGTQDAVSRWNGAVLKFSGMNPEQKMQRVLSAMASLLTIVLFFFFEISENTMSHPLLSLILSRRWEHSLNIYAISYVVIITVEILMASIALRALIGWFSMGVDTRSETICRMLQNFIKYFSIIGAVLYGIQFLGVDSTTILTGTGIVTLGVSLGSQSLVADIMAGIFIVFEGEFRVGDIITIDDFRGSVEEIGIRTTKVNKAGNIKIFRNSQISGVLNMTKENSYAICCFQVAYRTDLRQLEAIFAQEFPKIRNRIPTLTSDLKYMGVSELGDSGVTIMVRGTCDESQRVNTERALNREMKLLMDDYQVEIPFPQLVVHQPSEDPILTIPDHDKPNNHKSSFE